MAQKFTKEINGIKIDPLIFTFKFSCKCGGECCHYGVYTDKKESELILSLKDKLFPLMDETQSKDTSTWFEEPEEDEDFDSGIAVGTEVINEKCNFLDKNGLCVLPLVIYEGALTIDDEHIDRLKTCNKNPVAETSIYEACREELIHLFGERAFSELDEYRKEFLDSQDSKEVA
jgi:hypothetical protein